MENTEWRRTGTDRQGPARPGTDQHGPARTGNGPATDRHRLATDQLEHKKLGWHGVALASQKVEHVWIQPPGSAKAWAWRPDKLSIGWGYHFRYQYFAFHISGRISFRLVEATIPGTNISHSILVAG